MRLLGLVKRVGVGDKSEAIGVRVSAWCLCGCGEKEDLGFAALRWDWDRECGRKERERLACMVMMVVEQEHRRIPDQTRLIC